MMSRLLGCILFSSSFHARLISPLLGETETIQPGNGRRMSPFSNVSYRWFRGWGCMLSCLLSKRYCTVSQVCLPKMASWFPGYSLLLVLHVPLYTGFLRICNSVVYVPIL